MSAVIGSASQPELEYDHLFKLLIIGDSGVGKTNLLLRFADDVYQNDSEATIGVDFKICSRTVSSKRVKLQIWDTAGQERFRVITASYYRGSQGIMVVYDVTDRTSFEHVRGWLQDIEKYAKPSTQLILVASKIDLTNRRVVSTEEGAALAEELGVEFIETSALHSHNIDSSFDLMCAELLKSLPACPPGPVSGKPSAEKEINLGEICQDVRAGVCCQ
jgi:Ras-related protein Rab-1A